VNTAKKPFRAYGSHPDSPGLLYLKNLVKGKLVYALLVVSGLLGGPSWSGRLLSQEPSKVRQPVVAGQFYPAQPGELARMLDQLLAKAEVPAISGRIVAVIAPHAGYIYSGGVAAQSYALLKGQKFERVVVIAPSHFESFPFASVYDGDAYATPLGVVPVDKDFAARLAKLSPLLKLSSRGHVPGSQQGEHALEVQLPFLQRVLGEFKLVPIVMGEQNYQVERALGVSLAKMISGTDTLIVVSSDLSHYHTYDQASALDHKTLAAIERWDYLSLSDNFQAGIWEACGGGPIVAAMIAAERLGANEARILKYANTGDVTTDRSRVVGYGAVALIRSASPAVETEGLSLGQKERQTLIQLARQSVETAVKDKKPFEPAATGQEPLQQERGVFVTLKEKGELRGCIGLITAQKPLYLAVRDAATLAAIRDPRFMPVSVSELPQLEYEISVLSPFRRVYDVKDIQVGKHGLLIIRGDSEGVLLPQVAIEQRWQRKTFLEEACVKAGLPRQAWKDEATDIFVFSALVFDEHKVSEPVTPQ
jgi:MEMO1 family protein